MAIHRYLKRIARRYGENAVSVYFPGLPTLPEGVKTSPDGWDRWRKDEGQNADLYARVDVAELTTGRVRYVRVGFC